MRWSTASAAKRGSTELKLSARLAVAARGHSYDMAMRHYFLIRVPTALVPEQRIRGSGIDYAEVGENIYMEDYPDHERLAERAVKGWLGSPGHRKNMLSPIFTERGSDWRAPPTARPTSPKISSEINRDGILRTGRSRGGHAQARTIQVALKLEIFEALAGGARLTPTLWLRRLAATRAPRTARQCRKRRLGLLEKRDGRYHLSATVAALFDRGGARVSGRNDPVR